MLKKKKVIIPLVLLILAAFIGLSIYRTQAENEIVVKTGHIKEEELTTTVMIPGTLSLADEQKVYEDLEKGDVETVHVSEGDTVKAGAPLVTYSSDTIELEQQQADLTRQSTNMQIESLNKQLNRLDEKQDELEKEVGKKAADEQIDAERDQLNLELDTAKLERKRNNLELDSLEKQREALTVTSKIDGTVLSVQQGEQAASAEIQEPLVHVGQTGAFLAKGVLSEYDALNVKNGQPVTITSDVLPDQQWTGVVTKVNLLPEQDAAAQADANAANQYPVEVKINGADISTIKPGFKLLLDIETNQKTASVLPVEAVFQEEDNPYVFVVKNGQAIKKTVKTGIQADKWIEVSEGLTGKDDVITNPDERLSDGMDVTVE
ncbi:efflux RND transporter periplasmic adaptor subunit [Domibacillus indicus]|uniref:efflux RND transporter periplasmic adaptor subunit n=1 Tax=Domibacillus indicus TaxID=1437523 RepID=UPI0006182B93|nr:efflux RND transporter periplasmic adaptor subunit [Domibacillus indicus]